MRYLVSCLFTLLHLVLRIHADNIDYNKLLGYDDDDDKEDDGGGFVGWNEDIDYPTSEPPGSYFVCPSRLPLRDESWSSFSEYEDDEEDDVQLWPFPYGPHKYPALYDLCSGLSPFPNAGCLCRAPGYSTAMQCYTPPGNKDIFDSLLLEYCMSECFCRITSTGSSNPPPRPPKRHHRPLSWIDSPVTSFSDGEERRAWVNKAYGGWRVIEERGSGAAKVRLELVVTPPRIPVDIPEPNQPPLSPLSPRPPAKAVSSPAEQGECKAKGDCNSFEALNGGCGAKCRCFFDAASAPWFGKGKCGAALAASVVQAFSGGLNGRDLDDIEEDPRAAELWHDGQLESGVCACNASFVARACCASELGGMLRGTGEDMQKLGELSFEL